MADPIFKLPQMTDAPDEVSVPSKETFIRDIDWLRIGNSPSTEAYDEDALKYQYRSSVFSELMDTSIGGHYTINPQYSWGPTSDMHYRGRMGDSKVFHPGEEAVNIGLGRYYSEAINSNSKVRTLIIEAGIPEFKPFFSYIVGAVDVTLASIVSSGRTTFWYNLGRAAGRTVTFIAFPVFTAFWMVADYALTKIVGYDDPRYYHFRPVMPQFFGKMNTILNTLAADAGILTGVNTLSKVFGAKDAPPTEVGRTVEINSQDKEFLAAQLPHLFKNDDKIGVSGLIDVAGIVGSFQLMIKKNLEQEQLAFESGNPDYFTGIIDKRTSPGTNAFMDSLRGLESFKDKDPFAVPSEKLPDSKTSKGLDPSDLKYIKPNKDTYKKARLPHDNTSWLKSFAQYYKSTVDTGLSVLPIQVDYIGASTDTFQNTIKDIPLAGILNGSSKRIREARFSISDGNVFGDAIQSIVQAGADVVKGLLDAGTFGLTSVTSALNGNGMLDFPKMWDDSSTQLATHSFKLRLNSPYNNKISNLLDIYLPLSALLSMMLPNQIGRSAYGSPYILKGFMQGVFNSDMCMMTSLTITRGAGNLGFNSSHAPTDLEVTFTLTDLSPVISSPTPNGIMGMYELSLDDYSGFNRYSKILTGQSYEYSKFISKKAMLRLSKQSANLDSMFSPEYWGRVVGDSVLGRVHTLFVDADVSSVTMFSGN